MINKYLIPFINISSYIKPLIYNNSTYTIYTPPVGSLFGKRGTLKPSAIMADCLDINITFVTLPNENAGRELGRRLVEHKLAACVNMIKSVESFYEWEGKIQQDNEVMLMIKTHSSRTKDLTEFVEKNHPYSCPEVITTKIDSGSEKYLNWVREQVSHSSLTTETGTSNEPQSNS